MYRSKNVVLLLTHSDDYFTVDRVAAALSKLGVIPFRLNTDKFPLEVELTAKISNREISYSISYKNCSINIEQVQAVWMRRIWIPKLVENLDLQYRQACIKQSQITLDCFLDSLRGVRWIDSLEKIKAAENKMRQLRLARSLDLLIPPTLITNNPQEVEAFFRKLEGKMVTKLLSPLSYSMERSSFFFFTSSVKEEDLKEIESLRYCPMIFQAEIPKKRELRIIFVNGKFFVGALEASTYQDKTMDWRSAKTDDCIWLEGSIPQKFADKIQQLMAKLGLIYGAIDAIEQPNGEIIFLEVNPCGEWGTIEKYLGLPISNAIAEALVQNLY